MGAPWARGTAADDGRGRSLDTPDPALLMCGIAGCIGARDLTSALAALAHRGPDASGFQIRGPVTLGHRRLSILDPDPRSNQPFQAGAVSLTYNGELWNYQELRAELQALGRTFITTGDTEVIAQALDAWGPAALQRFHGMFALGWTTGDGAVHLARDRFGEVPLHYAPIPNPAFASERKALQALGIPAAVHVDVPPGSHITLSAETLFTEPYTCVRPAPLTFDRPSAAAALRSCLDIAARERAISDVPVCTLLSGGLDSAVIAATLLPHIPYLVAYTAVLDPRSPDLRAARAVASHLGITLREIPIPLPTPADLSFIISRIEMPYKAQIEIGWACHTLAKQIAADGFKVTFSGEGSDELWASYGFSYHGIQHHGWHAYRRALFLSQSRKNFARCNKIFLASGVECRLPFLHVPLVDLALGLSQETVADGTRRPKAVLEDAAADLLPPAIRSRRKLAFQDGLGLKAAITHILSDPARYYRAEFARQFS